MIRAWVAAGAPGRGGRGGGGGSGGWKTCGGLLVRLAGGTVGGPRLGGAAGLALRAGGGAHCQPRLMLLFSITTTSSTLASGKRGLEWVLAQPMMQRPLTFQFTQSFTASSRIAPT